jgi:hypothetical protein
MTTIKRLIKSKSCTFLFLCLTGFSISFPASAELDLTGLYSGFQYSESEQKFDPDSGSSVKDNRGHLKVKLGKILNDNFSIEGQLGLITDSDEKRGIATSGVYLRAGKDFGQYKLYGLLGYSGVHFYHDQFEDDSDSSGSYGVGLEIFGNKHIAVTLEYLRMLDKSLDDGDLTFDTMGIGFTYYFIDDTSYFNKNRNKIDSIRY